MTSFVAGVLAGVSADSLLHPLDNLKCIYQTRTDVDLKSFRSVSALYRGFPTVLVGSVGNGVFYLVYDKAKTLYRPIMEEEVPASARTSTAPSRSSDNAESRPDRWTEDLIHLLRRDPPKNAPCSQGDLM